LSLFLFRRAVLTLRLGFRNIVSILKSLPITPRL
jgi:hypothetical protein